MSELTLFIIGAVVFAITVYGTVMAAGIALDPPGRGRGDHADRRLLTTPATPARHRGVRCAGISGA